MNMQSYETNWLLAEASRLIICLAAISAALMSVQVTDTLARNPSIFATMVLAISVVLYL
jgi:hypothetical protein